VILQQYFTYFYLSGNADLTNFYEFNCPAIKRLKTGFLSAAGDAPGKTDLKKLWIPRAIFRRRLDFRIFMTVHFPLFRY
jgi:hypothetical protein